MVGRTTGRSLVAEDWTAPLLDRFDSFEVLVISEECRSAIGPKCDLDDELVVGTLDELHSLVASLSRS